MSFKLTGLEQALGKLVRLRNMLGRSKRVRLRVSPRTAEILVKQAAMGRNVTNLRAAEKREIAALARRHVERARDKSGKVKGGEAESREMYRELGEKYRQIVADHIDDTRKIHKRKLTDAYAKQKRRKWGRTHPILVASGDLLEDVREATVRVESR